MSEKYDATKVLVLIEKMQDSTPTEEPPIADVFIASHGESRSFAQYEVTANEGVHPAEFLFRLGKQIEAALEDGDAYGGL